MDQRAEGTASVLPPRHGQRIALILDLVARIAVVVLVLLVLRRLDAPQCELRVFCDDPGVRGALVAPLVAYGVWNLGFIVLELLAFATVERRDSVAFVAAGAAPRLLWLGPLAVKEFQSWPWLAPLVVLTLMVVGLAIYPVVARIPAIAQGIDSDTILG